MSAVSLTQKDFKEKTQSGLSLIDFWAPWCGPCKMAGPVIDELAEEYKNRLLVAKVNVDEEAQLAADFSVMSIPTVVLLEDGKEVERITGFVGREGYKNLIDKYLKNS